MRSQNQHAADGPLPSVSAGSADSAESTSIAHQAIYPALVLLLFGYTGCTGAASKICNDAVFGSVLLEEEVDATCSQINEATRLARDLLEDSGLWPGMHHAARSVEILIRQPQTTTQKPDYWVADGLGVENKKVGGITYPTGNIDITPSMWALVHELFHVKDVRELRLDALPNPHLDWDKNGRLALAELYELMLIGIVRCDNSGFTKPQEAALLRSGWDHEVGRLAATKKCDCRH